MSSTDINPPVSYSLDASYRVTTRYWNLIGKRWRDPILLEGTIPNESGVETRVGSVTPGYISAAALGRLPENTFGYSRSETKRFIGVLKYEKPKLEQVERIGAFPPTFCNFIPVYSITPARKFNLDNEAKQRVLEKIRDTDVNLAVVYGERERTLKLLTNSVKRLGVAYSHAKRGDLVGAANALGLNFTHSSRGSPRRRARSIRNVSSKQVGSIARGWLELQYGWRPLISDIYGSMKQLEQSLSTRKEFVIVKAKKKIEEDFSYPIVSADYKDTVHSRETYTSLVTVKMTRGSTVLRTLSELGLTNPALVVWELVPFSFVVDWAVPISSFISQLDSTLGWNHFSSSITRITDRTATLERTSAGPSGYTYHHCFGEASSSDFAFSRTGLGSFASLFSLPVIKNPLSVEHALNALALLNSKR
jgi:hypothetical protein